MKKLIRLWFIASAVLLAAACARTMEESISVEESALANVFGAQAADENLLQGQMTLLLSEDLTAEVEANTGDDGMVNISRVSALAPTKVGIKITGMTRLFPYAGRFEERTRREGLHRWYTVEFDQSVPLTKAAGGFVKADGIDQVEMNPQIYIVGNPEVVAETAPSKRASAVPSATLPFDDPYLYKQWHYYNDGTTAASAQSGCDVNVFPVWRTYTTGREDVVVGVVDGGIDYEHEDLAANMWNNPNQSGNGRYGYNFITNSYVITPHDHGTHVGGTIAAVNNNGIGVCGIAGGNATEGQPGVKLMSCQIFASNTKESGSGANAIKWSADHGAVISQNSWGFTDPSMTDAPSSLKSAIDYFIKYAGFDENGKQVGPMAGGIVIFAAGNENQDHSSVRYEKSVLVTSVGADYRRAYYSNWGDYANIAAPGGDVKKGNQVYSTLPGNKYGMMQGTSMACPHVSGVAALIVSRYGGIGFTPDALRSRLLDNTTDISSYNRNYYMGTGLVNAYKAIAGSGGVAPDAPTNLKASSQSNNITVSVTVPEDSDDGAPSAILIYYDKEPISDLKNAMFSSFYVGDLNPGETLTGKVTGLEFECRYYMVAVACDLAGNHSGKSNSVEVTTGPNSTPVIELLSAASFTLKPHESARVLMKAYDPDGHFINFDLQKASEAETLDTLDKSAPKVDIIARLAPTGTYKSKLVVTDVYGASTVQNIEYTILENHAPAVVNKIPDQIFSARAAEAELAEADCFRDDDGEQLAYTIVNTDENVANVNYSKGKFYITSLNFGICEVTVTATDVRGEKAVQSFRILVRDSKEAVDIYPNPVIDYMYVRTDKEASAEIKIVSSLGKVYYDNTVAITPFEPAKIDMQEMPGGSYTVEVICDGSTVTKSIVKL